MVKRDAGGKNGKLLCCKRIFDLIKASLAEIQLKKHQKTHFLQKVPGVNGSRYSIKCLIVFLKWNIAIWFMYIYMYMYKASWACKLMQGALLHHYTLYMYSSQASQAFYRQADVLQTHFWLD